MRGKEWYRNSYRRNLVDMHVEDWDPRFLSKLSPEKYVEMLKLANVKSAMVYANSHVGYCYWPTKTGHMHRGLGGRDFLGSVIELCHKADIDVVVYYSLIYNNWAYEQHPEWRIIDLDGQTSRRKQGQEGRYGVVCPNSGYRRFVLDQITELCRGYEFEGVFFDMTFWPAVCYCPSCRERFAREEGESLPTIVNWDDPHWLKFQKRREQWLAEFAAMATSAVKGFKPEVTVEHQTSTLPGPWRYGVDSALAEQCDFVDGDFYGGALQQSFVCKLFLNTTRNKPFAFSTSICFPRLSDHTTVKTKELIESHAFLAVAHNGAFLIIDAIDPTGTLEKKRYRVIGKVYEKIKGYERFLGGELCQDVAVYFSFGSKMNFAENGRQASPEALKEYAWTLPHLDAALVCAETLRASHIPFGVITKNLGELRRHQVVMLPNVLKMSDEEVDAVKNYVEAGGSVYASKFSLKSKLSEVLGVSGLEETREKTTYIAPTAEGKTLFKEVTREHPLSISDTQIKVKQGPDGGVLATIVLPYTDADDSTRFASIHSNPPGVRTRFPAVIHKRFGKGSILWSSASIESFAVKSLKHRNILAGIVRFLAKEPFSFEAEAPECVEAVVFHKPNERRYLINVVNFQSEIGAPNIPVNGVKLKVKIKGRTKKILSQPEGRNVPFKQDGEYVVARVPRLQTFRMLTLDYE